MTAMSRTADPEVGQIASFVAARTELESTDSLPNSFRYQRVEDAVVCLAAGWTFNGVGRNFRSMSWEGSKA